MKSLRFKIRSGQVIPMDAFPVYRASFLREPALPVMLLRPAYFLCPDMICMHAVFQNW
jgi:hypothetical protein